jgi:hypothetical protein
MSPHGAPPLHALEFERGRAALSAARKCDAYNLWPHSRWRLVFMIRAACHCTAVRLEIGELPDWVLDCNCTLCRRYGAIWSYPKAWQVEIVSGEDATDTYLWGDRGIAFHRCKDCGCVMYMVAAKEDPPFIFGVNARMIPTLDPKSVRLRQKDNGHTGWFWTRSDAPPEASHHPKMDPPSESDWR